MKASLQRQSLVLLLCLAWGAAARGADGLPPAAVAKPPAGPDAKQAAAADAKQLAIHQGAIADKYSKLEKLLEDMARIEAVNDPRRAALLMKALELSKENLTGVKLNRCVTSLEQFEAKNKTEREGVLGLQREAQQDIKALLELLLSENRSNRLKREQDRVREYIKEVERILRLQKSVQGRTEGGSQQSELAKDQGKVADRTGELAKQIRENEEGGDQKQADGQSGSQAQGQQGSPGEGKPREQPKAEGQGKGKDKGKDQGKEQGKSKDQPAGKESGESKPQGKAAGQGQGKSQSQAKDAGQKTDSGQPGEGQGRGKKQPQEGPGQGQQGQSQGQDQDQGQQNQPAGPPKQDEGNPARKRLEAAQERMREAQKRLDEAKRKDAVAEQEKAKEELEKAKAELERILRQMREEEVERVLALLESRFRKMLEIQVRIYEDTVRLDKVPEAERDLKIPIPAGKLASDERKLVVEADKALNLLLEEGSSVAFPETVSQMRDDMQQVSSRLDAAKVESITQGIAQDIIAALQEMIEALQKAQKDLEQQKQQQRQPPPGQPQDMPLVDAIAELKMIRALQMRVNTRTVRYARLLDNAEDPVGQATDQDLREALTKLAERQETIYRLTRDIVLGKNK